MITRRAFLSALAALPLVGRWMPKADPLMFHRDAFVFTWPMPTDKVTHLWRFDQMPGWVWFKDSLGYLHCSRPNTWKADRDRIDAEIAQDREHFSGDQWTADTRAERIFSIRASAASERASRSNR